MKSGIEHIVATIPVPRSEFESEEFHNLTHGNAFPASPVERQLFYRDDLHQWYIYNGTAWITTDVSAHAALKLSAAVHPNTAMAKAYLGVQSGNIPQNRNLRVELDTAAHDPGSNLQLGAWYDNVQADADSDATHIEDDDGNFVAALIGAGIAWTSDGIAANAGTGFVLAVTDVDTLSIQKLTGADFGASYYYTINHADYKAPVAGWYWAGGGVCVAYGTVVPAKMYRGELRVNGALKIRTINHSATGVTNRISMIFSTLVHLDANDLVSIIFFHLDGVGTSQIEDNISDTNLSIFLIQAD